MLVETSLLSSLLRHFQALIDGLHKQDNPQQHFRLQRSHLVRKSKQVSLQLAISMTYRHKAKYTSSKSYSKRFGHLAPKPPRRLQSGIFQGHDNPTASEISASTTKVLAFFWVSFGVEVLGGAYYLGFSDERLWC